MEVRELAVCHQNTATIQCTNDTTIIILNAFYGSDAHAHVCGDVTAAEHANDTTCESDLAFAAVSELCNGKQECLVEATENLLGSACNDSDVMQLRVSYACTG